MKRRQMKGKSLTAREIYNQFQRYNPAKGLSKRAISCYGSYNRVFFTFLDAEKALIHPGRTIPPASGPYPPRSTGGEIETPPVRRRSDRPLG